MRDLNKTKLRHDPRIFQDEREALGYCLRYCQQFKNGCALDCQIRKHWKIPPHGNKYPQE